MEVGRDLKIVFRSASEPIIGAPGVIEWGVRTGADGVDEEEEEDEEEEDDCDCFVV